MGVIIDKAIEYSIINEKISFGLPACEINKREMEARTEPPIIQYVLIDFESDIQPQKCCKAFGNKLIIDEIQASCWNDAPNLTANDPRYGIATSLAKELDA